MSRNTIFDILESKMDIDYEIFRIESLCKEEAIEEGYTGYTLEDFIDQYCLADWKNRNRCISCEEMRNRLNISSFHIKHQLQGNQILIYLEYIANLVQLCNTYISNDSDYDVTQSYVYLQNNLIEVIHDLNYETMVFEEEEKVLLVEKNAATSAVVEIVEPELAFEIIEYNHFLLKGDIDKKQKILKVMADKFEPLRSELKKVNKDLESNTGYLLNKINIRHNNIEGKNAIPYVQNLSKEELEEWYDETYQMLLLCMLEYDNIKRTEKVVALKKIIEKC